MTSIRLLCRSLEVNTSQGAKNLRKNRFATATASRLFATLYRGPFRLSDYEESMRSFVLLCVCALTACSAEVPDPTHSAVEYIGLDEHRDREELRGFVGVDPVRTQWCAAFVNAVLASHGVEGSGGVSDYPLTARSFLSWGVPVSSRDVLRGDIVVFPRGSSDWQGHVGFYWGTVIRKGVVYYQILGGNQSNRVGIELYRADRALGIRRAMPVREQLFAGLFLAHG